MARYALLSGNTVINVAICEDDIQAKLIWPDLITINLDQTGQFAGIGWQYINGEFIDPTQTQIDQ